MDPILPRQYNALKNTDHLFDTKCLCLICVNSPQTPNPEISIDHKYQLLKSSKPKILSRHTPSFSPSKDQKNIQGLEWYLKKLAFECKTLPDFPILDTFVMQKGQLSLYIYFENSKPKIHLNSLLTQSQSHCKYSQSLPYSLNTLKQKFMERKTLNEIDYQKTKYKEINPSFEYAQLDHDSQKLIKDFEKKVKFLDQVLNRFSTIKKRDKTYDQSPSKNQPYRLKGSTTPVLQQETSQKIISRYEFMNLFDKTRVKVCEMQEVSYMQLFPIMYGQEEQSYVRQVKYFREMQFMKPLFKQAQTFVLAWLQKNDTLQKMEQQFIKNHFYTQTNLRKVGDFPATTVKRLSPHAEQQFLMYQSCKLLLHLEAETSIEISQCLLQFITVNNGATFYLKSLNYIKYSQKPTVLAKENKLPVYKNIDKDDYIQDMQKEMRQMFENVSYQYERLNNDWENFENKTKNDRMHSDQVFKTVRGFEELNHMEKKDQNEYFLSLEDFQPVKFQSTLKQQKDDNLNLHKILKSTNQKYKEEMLGLNAKFKTNPHQPKITSRTKIQAKNSKK